MEFRMVERTQRPPNSYRLACVEDVIKNAEMLREEEILTELRTVRLLDGWVDRHLRPEVGFRKHMNYMLVARAENIGLGGVLRKQLYSGISLSDKGREAALLLSCDDENREVIYWLLIQSIDRKGKPHRLRNALYNTFQEKTRKGYLQVVDGLLGLAARLAKNHIIDWKTELHSARELQNVVDQLISAEFIFRRCSAQNTHGKGKRPWDPSEKVDDDTANVELRCLLKEALEKGYTEMVYGLLELGSGLTPQPEIVHGSDGKTLLHYAAELDDRENALNIIKVVVEKYRGGEELVRKRDEYGTTVLHLASLFGHGNLIDYLVNKDLFPKDSLNEVRDEYGQNPLHYAAKGNHGNEEIVDKLVKQDYWTLVSRDRKGKTPLHVASEEGHRKTVEKLLSNSREPQGYALRTDSFGQTALHKAASRGHSRIVRRLLEFMGRYTPDWDKAGRTSLHFAVLLDDKDSAIEITKMLLHKCPDEIGKYLLLCSPAVGIGSVMQSARWNKRFLGGERTKLEKLLMDRIGSAAMYFMRTAVSDGRTYWRRKILRQIGTENSAGGGMQRSLSTIGKMRAPSRTRGRWNENDWRELLAQIRGPYTKKTGEIDESVSLTYLEVALEALFVGEEWFNHIVERFKQAFKDIKFYSVGINDNLVENLFEAFKNEGLDKSTTINTLVKIFFEALMNEESVEVPIIDTLVGKLIQAFKNEGLDKPATIDTLGRPNFAAGVAALFLSPYVKSPITVGILGGWGMGKSSVMLQTEKVMLQTASFPHLLPPESLPDGAEIVPNENWKNLFQMICQEVKLEGDAQVASLASKLYRSKYHGILKSLASMDRSSMFRMYDHDKDSFSKYSGGGHMNIMTVFYNAWHYRDEHEAWAGLAVEITKEIESAMTGAQWLSTCWRYASTRERESFYLQVILPSLIAIMVAVGVVVVAWILLTIFDNINKMLSGFIRYGSIPATLVGIAWVVMESVFSILKPVSSQMAGYMKFPEHAARLGYQQKVINDIIFLKEELGREPKLFCSLIANTWWPWNWFGLCPKNVGGTAIPKLRPASGEKLRIVVFVDDLDRCQNTVILKVLSAINLVLAACEIDVVLGIDDTMIERAIQKEYADIEESDEIKKGLAENYMRKIIQIPLVLSHRSDLAFEQLHGFGKEEGSSSSSDDDAPQETVGSHVSPAHSGEYGVNIEGDDPATINRHNTSLKMKMCGLVYNTIHNLNIQKICGLVYNTISSCIPCVNIQKKFAWGNESELQWNSDAFAWYGEELAGQRLKFSYSREEREAFVSLSQVAKIDRQPPRELKEYQNYHFVARNILSKDPNVQVMEDWQLQLIAWIFCCWQWRRQINIIIQNWDELVQATVSNVRQPKNRSGKYGPSLGEIVDYYIAQKLPSEQNFVNENVLLQEARAKKEEQKAWLNLKGALLSNDVSMEAIQCFQGFRFHCNTGHLSWNRQWRQKRL